MNIKALLLNTVACAGAFGLMTSVAAAQGQAAPAPYALDEVVVTAQRRSERLQNVPIAVTAIDAQKIQAAGIVQVTDLGKITPSLLTSQGSGFITPYIRGIGSRAITPGNESTVATYVDGVYQTDKQGILLSGFSDVQRVEVLRGPQGTLFGRNATAGAILMTTKGPSDRLTFNVDGTYGSDEWGGRLFVAGPIASTLSGSVAVFLRHETPYIRNLNPANGAGSKTGDAEGKGVRAKLKWAPTEDFSAVLAADYVDTWDAGPWTPQAIAGTGLTAGEGAARARGIAIPDIRDQRPVYAGEVKPKIHAKGQGQSLTMNWDLPFVSIKSITAHRQDSTSGRLDLDGTPVPLFYFTTDLRSHVWQQELNVSSRSEGPFSWIGGVYYLHMRDGYQNLDQNVGIPFPYTPQRLAALAPGASHTNQFSYVTIRSLGVFGEVTYKFTDATRVTLGIRYTDEKHTLDSDNIAVTVLPDGAGGLRTVSTRTADACARTPTCTGLSTPFSKYTYRAVLTHNFTPDVMAYASYNRGFKSGVYNISTITNIAATRPETVDAFEVGFKSELLGRRLMLNGAAYYNDYKDLQVPVTTPGNNTQISINAARARISGLELEARFRATENLTLSAAGSTFLKREYKSFPNCSVYTPAAAGNTTTSGACTGKRLPGTPDTFNVQADYTMPLSSGATLNFNALYAYSSTFDMAPYASEITRAPRQEPIHTVNLSGTWRSPDEHSRITIWGRDLADQDDIFRGLFTTNFGYATTFARGATYGLTVGYDF